MTKIDAALRMQDKTSKAIGEMLSPTKSQILEPPLTYERCPVCKDRLLDNHFKQACTVCFRRLQFKKLPAEGQQRELAVVVPNRYLGAELSDLSEPLASGLTEANNDGVLLWGSPGVGKTYAFAALAKTQIAAGYLTKRIHYETLCLKLRDTFNPKATETEWGIIEPLLNCDRLYIEDVGTTKSIGKLETDFSVRTFIVLLDIRLEHCRPTFITSNKNVENLTKSFDERVGDRLRMFKVFELRGESKRG